MKYEKEHPGTLTPRPEEKYELTLILKLAGRIDAQKNNLDAARRLSGEIDRQPLLLELFMEGYVLKDTYTEEQLDEILGALLLVWLFHEEYYGNHHFRPVTAADYYHTFRQQEQRITCQVKNEAAMNRFFEGYEPRMLLAHLFKVILSDPAPAFRRLGMETRLELLLSCMTLTACFQAQLKPPGGAKIIHFK